jgi:hypothetical protein
MKFSIPKCPTCGELTCGTLEMIPGIALLDINDDGTAEYAGETEPWWDDQETWKDSEGRVQLRCDNGHSWQSKKED